MENADFKVPYEAVAAYNAMSGINTLNTLSGNYMIDGFSIRWDSQGVTGSGWEGPGGIELAPETIYSTIENILNNGTPTEQADVLVWIAGFLYNGSGCAAITA